MAYVVKDYEMGVHGRLRAGRDELGDPFFIGIDVIKGYGIPDSKVTRVFKDVPEEFKSLRRIFTEKGSCSSMLTLAYRGLSCFFGRIGTVEAESYMAKVDEIVDEIGKGKMPETEAASVGRLEPEVRLMTAELLSSLADSGLYNQVQATVFRAKAVSILTEEPEAKYLPPNTEGK
ncbi:MAG: hypothetical protein LBW85_09700 [Deltaproteobacteria bacterium]|jgi:hypothetical protein|nr:hypothetical protein [Deltaproteobacteria bacterium]